ncbi:hypothetical protein RN04_02640 [Arthrobacter sp. W1]|nr:hypothetical protein RN04_02640 [Arthrobacter sp. W1]
MRVTLAAGETIISVSRYTTPDAFLGIGPNGNGWTEGVPAAELPDSGPGQVAYWDINIGWGDNQWEFGISNGTTTVYMKTPFLNVAFDDVLVRTTYQNGGTLSGSTPTLGLDGVALMDYTRNGSTQNLVHKVPGRTGRPLVKYRTGQTITSTMKLLISGDVNRSAENKLLDVEKMLGAAGELIIRRPSLSTSVAKKLPDIRGAVENYSVNHATVHADTEQESVVWFVDVTLVENRNYS